MNAPQDNLPSAEDEPTKTAGRKSFRRTAIVLLIWLVICSGLLTWLVVAVRQARESAEFSICFGHLKQLEVALRNFDYENGSLPPAYLCDEKGKPIHSWQVFLAPYIYYDRAIRYSLKEPWDSPNNSKFHPEACRWFHCSSVPSVEGRDRLTIDYVAVVGPDTMWPGRERVTLPTSGNRDTILLIELPDSDYRCLEPRFPTVDEFITKIKSPTGKGIRCIHPKGLAYVTVGRELRWFSPDTDPETIRRLFKRDPSCKVISPDEKMRTVEDWGKEEADK